MKKFKPIFFLLLTFLIPLLFSCVNRKSVNTAYIEKKFFTSETIKKADLQNGNKTIYLGPGEYKVNLDIKEGVSLIGAGSGKTILRPDKKIKPVITKSGAGKIENMTIIDGGENWDCNGLYLSNSNAEIKNCVFKNNKFCGIYGSYFSGKILDSVIEENEFDGIKLYNSQNAILRNNILRKNGDDGIQLLHSSITIDSNLIEENKGNAIELWYDGNSGIMKNTIVSNCGAVSAVCGNIPSPEKFFNNNINGQISNPRENQESLETVKKNEKKVEKQTSDQPVEPLQVKMNSLSKIENIDSALYYSMLEKQDFNISYRLGPDTLETQLFTKLFSATLETPRELTIISDSILSAPRLSEKLDELFSVAGIKYIDDSFTLNGLFSTPAASEKIDTLPELPDILPQTMRSAITEIFFLTDIYYKEYDRIKKTIPADDFNFIRDSILNVFSENRPQPAMNLRERIKNSDDTDKENLKLKKLLDTFDISNLHIIGRRIIAAAEKIRNAEAPVIDWDKLHCISCWDIPTKFGKIIIGNTYNNVYDNSDCFIMIELGGNDIYRNLISTSNEKKLVSLYFDFAGNDNYISDTHFDICSSVFGVSYLYDRSGNDRYTGLNNSCASSYFGIAALDDATGNDFYECSLYGIGAATEGYAVLADAGGNDIYQSGAYSEGFGSVRGYGIISENGGNDYYLSGNQIVDSIRYYANYITMSQGCGFGIRPYIPGGIGLLIDREGNDMYKADIFGQATSYWQAIGGLIDYSGDDKYLAQRYSQGTGIHLGISALIDFAGDDNYISFNVSQGCGHDISFGILYDYSGDDFYKNMHVGLGSGITTAIGVLADINGNDGYFSAATDQGFGEYLVQREFGGIGVLFDKHGKDMYYNSDGTSKDKTINLKNRYGIFYDKE